MRRGRGAGVPGGRAGLSARRRLSSPALHVVFSILTLTPGQMGGSETYVRGVLGAFARGRGPSRVTVLAPGPAAAGLESNGVVSVEPVGSAALAPGRGARTAGLLRLLASPPSAARRAAAAGDVLHLPFTVPVPRAPVPTVVSLYDVLHHDLPSMFSLPERSFRRLAYDRAARRADAVVTVSEHSRARIADRLGIEPRRIFAITPGVDHDRFRPGPAANDAEVLRGLGLPEGPWLLYPANLWPHKNHERLLAALARCAPPLSLVLTGATYGHLPALMAAARRHGVGDRVLHAGFLPEAALPPLYRAATGLVFPSLAEGFGTPVLEAMACGCPVAATERGAVAEACGGAALGFPPDDPDAMAAAMTRLATDDTLRAELAEAGLQRAGEATWERCAERHCDAYEAALSARSTASRP